MEPRPPADEAEDEAVENEITEWTPEALREAGFEDDADLFGGPVPGGL